MEAGNSTVMHSGQRRLYNKNRYNGHGQLYELAVPYRLLRNAVENELKFEIGVEMKDHYKFDDVYLKYCQDEHTHIYYGQAKHVESTNQKITFEELISDADTRYSLPKYFNSFCGLRQLDPFSKQTFLIFTTISLDSDSKAVTDDTGRATLVLRRSNNQVRIEEIQDVEKQIMNFGKHYRLQLDDNLKKKVFRKSLEEQQSFIKMLVDHVDAGRDLVASPVDYKSSKNLLESANLPKELNNFRTFLKSELAQRLMQPLTVNIDELISEKLKELKTCVSILAADRTRDDKAQHQRECKQAGDGTEPVILKSINKCQGSIEDDEMPMDLQLVNEFLEKFQIVVTPNANDMLGTIAEELKTKHGDRGEQVHKTVQTDLQEWMRGEKGTFQDPEDNCYQRAKDRLLFSGLFDVRPSICTFTGREEPLKMLREALFDPTIAQGYIGPVEHAAVRPRICAITGLGGVGKSELARKFSEECEHYFKGNVIWINAEANGDLKDSFMRLAAKMNISLKMTNGQEKPVPDLAKEVSAWFNNDKVLFIFDNATQYRSAADGYIGIENVLPNGDGAFIIITSRNQCWPEEISHDVKVKHIALEAFSDEEALLLIKTSLQINDGYEAKIEMAGLASLLGNFPLALQQALAFIKWQAEIYRKSNKQFGIGEYIMLYNKDAVNALKYAFPESSTDTYRTTTFETWSITTDAIAKLEHGPISLEILQMMAFMTAYNIPTELFYGYQNRLQNCTYSEKDILNAVELLDKYSLIQHQDQNGLLQVHRLVQEVTRLRLEKDSDSVLQKAVNVIRKKWYEKGSSKLDKSLVTRKLQYRQLCLSVWAYASCSVRILRRYPRFAVDTWHLAAWNIRTDIAINMMSRRNKFLGKKVAAEEARVLFYFALLFHSEELCKDIAFQCVDNDRLALCALLTTCMLFGSKPLVEHLLKNNSILLEEDLQTAFILAAEFGFVSVVEYFLDHHYQIVQKNIGEALVKSISSSDFIGFMRGVHSGNRRPALNNLFSDLCKEDCIDPFKLLDHPPLEDKMKTIRYQNVLNFVFDRFLDFKPEGLEQHRSVTQILLQSQFENNVKKNDLKNALCKAASVGCHDLVTNLLKKYPELTDKHCIARALVMAASEGHKDVVKVLLSEVPPNEVKVEFHDLASPNIVEDEEQWVNKVSSNLFQLLCESGCVTSIVQIVTSTLQDGVLQPNGVPSMSLQQIQDFTDVFVRQILPYIVKTHSMKACEMWFSKGINIDAVDSFSQLMNAFFMWLEPVLFELLSVSLRFLNDDVSLNVDREKLALAKVTENIVQLVLKVLPKIRHIMPNIHKWGDENFGQDREFCGKIPPSSINWLPNIIKEFYADVRTYLPQVLVLAVSNGNSSLLTLLLEKYPKDVESSVAEAVQKAAILKDEYMLNVFLGGNLENVKECLGEVLVSSIRSGHQKAPVTLIHEHLNHVRRSLGKALQTSLENGNEELVSLLLDDVYRKDVEGHLSNALNWVSPDKGHLGLYLLTKCYQQVRGGLADFFKTCIKGGYIQIIRDLMVDKYYGDLREHLQESMVVAIDDNYDNDYDDDDDDDNDYDDDDDDNDYDDDDDNYYDDAYHVDNNSDDSSNETRNHGNINDKRGSNADQLMHDPMKILPKLGLARYLSYMERKKRIVEYLLVNHYNDVCSSLGRALVKCVDHGHDDIMKLLLSEPYIADSRQYVGDAVLEAVRCKKPRYLHFFIQCYKTEVLHVLYDALMEAVSTGSVSVISIFLCKLYEEVKTFLADALIKALPPSNNRNSIIELLTNVKYITDMEEELGDVLLECMRCKEWELASSFLDNYYNQVRKSLRMALMISVEAKNEMAWKLLSNEKYTDDIKDSAIDAYFIAQKDKNKSLEVKILKFCKENNLGIP